jgi:hypothetical protein
MSWNSILHPFQVREAPLYQKNVKIVVTNWIKPLTAYLPWCWDGDGEKIADCHGQQNQVCGTSHRWPTPERCRI